MVTVIVTDYIQSAVLAVAMFMITFFIIRHVGLTGIDESLKTNLGQAAFNPFVANKDGGYGVIWVVFFVMSAVLAPRRSILLLLPSCIDSVGSAKASRCLFISPAGRWASHWDR